MADYPIPTQLVVDERLIPAANAQVTVYDLNDTGNTTPLALKDLNGTPVPNPITTTANALSPAFLSPVTDVKFVAPNTGLALPVISVEGLKNAAQAAADDANAAKQFVTSISVGATTTGAAGTSAAVTFDSATGAFSFTIPTGVQGPPGKDGANTLPTDDAITQAVNDTTSQTRGALNGIFMSKAAGVINVRDYGAKGGGADDTAAFNDAMNAAVTRRAKAGPLSTVYVYVPTDFYRLANLSVPTGVHLWCDGAILGPVATVAGPMLTFPGSYSGISGAYLAGAGTSGADSSAIATTSASFHTTIRDCRFDNWRGRAIYDAPSAVATYIDNVFAQNCLLSADTLTGYTGVVELAGTDAWFDKSEITASRFSARGMSASKFACALAVTGANNMVRDIVAETSDHGVYVGTAATQSEFTGVRAELNYGHGWVIAGGSGRIIGCHALRNSQAGANQYNGFHTTGPTQYNTAGLYSESGGGHPTQNYGVLDTYGQTATYSHWDVRSIGDSKPRGDANTGMASFKFVDNPPTNMDKGTAVPFGGFRNLIAVNTAAINVTGFSNMVNGQRLTIKGDGFTTLVNGTSIATSSGANLLLAAGTWYNFIVTGGKLTQI